MTKLCPRGKAAAKRKFKVYPSAYANAYASKICAGKIKDPSGTKRKDWGPKKANKGLMVEKDKPAEAPVKQEKMSLEKARKFIKKLKKDVDPRKGLEFKRGRPPKGTSDHLGNPVVVREASKGRMFTAAQVRALDESTGPKANPKKKERIYQSGDKDRIKLSKSDLKRFSGGGMARGMGAAIKGGKFEGVF